MKRVLLSVTAALVGAVGSVVALGAPAQAAPAALSVVCDEAAGTVTASLSGQVFQPGFQKAIELRFRPRVSYVKATSSGIAPSVDVKLPATITPAGDVSGSYTWQWPTPSDYLFYNDKITVDVLDKASQGSWFARSASCGKDLRTTVTATCDPQTRQAVATVSGVRFNEGYPAGDFYGPIGRIEYFPEIGSGRFNEPGFIGRGLMPEVKSLTADPDGTFTRELIRSQFSSSPTLAWFSARLSVEIFNRGGVLIGKGTAYCEQRYPAPGTA